MMPLHSWDINLAVIPLLPAVKRRRLYFTNTSGVIGGGFQISLFNSLTPVPEDQYILVGAGLWLDVTRPREASKAWYAQGAAVRAESLSCLEELETEEDIIQEAVPDSKDAPPLTENIITNKPKPRQWGLFKW